MLKNDTLKNGTSRVGLYGSAPRGIFPMCSVAIFDISDPKSVSRSTFGCKIEIC